MRVLQSSLAIAALAAVATLSTTVQAAAASSSLEPESVLLPRQPAFQRRNGQPTTRSLAQLFGLTRRSGPRPSRRQQQRRRSESVAAEAGSPHARRAGTCSKKTSASSSRVAPSTTAKAASTTTAAAKATTSAAAPTASTGLIMGGYWPSWVNGQLPPESIDWTKYDYMCFAFATPNKDASLNLGDSDAGLLKKLVTAGHKGNSKVLLSIGGWGGSDGFSPSVATDAMRGTFVKSIRAIYDKYNLDGIDLDWEYPNSQFAGTYSPQDTANFQTFLGALRAGLPKGALITAAVSQSPWIASSGSPVGSVARAASAIDYIMIMNYDVWGADATPGPNAPLADLCGNSTQPGASAAAAVKQWSNAGMPRSKMILGAPLYGYLSTSSKRTLKQRSLEATETPASLYDLLSARNSETTNEKRALTQADGQINFDLLVSGGALKWSGSEFVASGGYTKYWDDCSDTPYLANGQKVVTYDDTDSLFDKGSFAAQAQLGGSAVWSVDGDVSDWTLTKALRSGMGLK